MNPLGRMIVDEKWEELGRAINERFEIAVAADQIRDVCVKVPRTTRFPEISWGDGTWFMWIKKRLQEGNLIGQPGQATPEPPEGWGCILHVGFISIIETAEELARLRWRNPQTDQTSLARSRIVKALPLGNVRPIDRTAALVAPENP